MKVNNNNNNDGQAYKDAKVYAKSLGFDLTFNSGEYLIWNKVFSRRIESISGVFDFLVNQDTMGKIDIFQDGNGEYDEN